MKLANRLPINYYQSDAMKSVRVNIGKTNRKFISMWQCWTNFEYFFFAYSTYKFACRVISREDGEIYAAKNVLERILDKKLDAKTTSPIERCHGFKIEGWFFIHLRWFFVLILYKVSTK